MEASKLFERAVELHRAERHEEAAELYEAVGRDVLTVNLVRNLGACLTRLERLDEAEKWYRTALHAKPDSADVAVALGELLLSQGRYAEGWPLYEARLRAWADRTPASSGPHPEWRGEPLNGKHVVVVIEQGFGDQIQFARFAPALKAAGASRVTLSCWPALADLLRTASEVDAVEPAEAGAATPIHGPHVWVRYLSLGARLGVVPTNIPGAPYLFAPARRAGGRIGVMPSGNPQHPQDRYRSLDPASAKRLLALPGAMSLRPEDTGARNFLETAEIVAGLDLVVTVDTSVAHLAGALGTPVWILLPRVGLDWRWMRERVDTPWYPTARLFRQTAAGDWNSVIDRVEAAIGAS